MMELYATVLTPVDDDYYCIVQPSYAVETAVIAFDIHRRKNLSVGEEVSIIQCGSQFGVAKKTHQLNSVLRIPASSRQSAMDEAPAMAAASYIGAVINRFQNFYVVGRIFNIMQSTWLQTLILDGEAAGRGFNLLVTPLTGLSATDFEPGELVVVNINQYDKPTVSGWWEAKEEDSYLVEFGARYGGGIVTAFISGIEIFSGDEQSLGATIDFFADTLDIWVNEGWWVNDEFTGTVEEEFNILSVDEPLKVQCGFAHKPEFWLIFPIDTPPGITIPNNYVFGLDPEWNGEGSQDPWEVLGTDLVMPKTIKGLTPTGIYSGLQNATSLQIPDSVLTIERDTNSTLAGSTGAFAGGSLVGVFDINNVEKLGFQTFLNCANLTGIVASKDNLKLVKREAFRGCTGIKNLDTFFMRNAEIEQPLINHDGIFHNCQVETAVIDLDGGVPWFFLKGNNLNSLILSNRIVTIGRRAFQDNPNLTSVTIPQNTTLIDLEAFRGCGLVTVELLSESLLITDGSFRDNPIESIDLQNVVSIGPLAFQNTSLRHIDLTAVTVTLGYNIFADTPIDSSGAISEGCTARLPAQSQVGFIASDALPFGLMIAWSADGAGVYEKELVATWPSDIYKWIYKGPL